MLSNYYVNGDITARSRQEPILFFCKKINHDYENILVNYACIVLQVLDTEPLDTYTRKFLQLEVVTKKHNY